VPVRLNDNRIDNRICNRAFSRCLRSLRNFSPVEIPPTTSSARDVHRFPESIAQQFSRERERKREGRVAVALDFKGLLFFVNVTNLPLLICLCPHQFFSMSFMIPPLSLSLSLSLSLHLFIYLCSSLFIYPSFFLYSVWNSNGNVIEESSSRYTDVRFRIWMSLRLFLGIEKLFSRGRHLLESNPIPLAANRLRIACEDCVSDTQATLMYAMSSAWRSNGDRRTFAIARAIIICAA